MADFTQTLSELLAHQLLTHPATFVGTAVSIVGDFEGDVHIKHANIEATANATGVSYLIQVSPEASGDEDWKTIEEIVTGTTAAATEAPSGSEAIGQTVIGVAATAGFAIRDIIYFLDGTTLADSEWGELENLVTDVSLDLIDGITVAKDTSDTLLNEAEVYVRKVNLRGVSRIRMVVIHRAATGSNIHFEAQILRATDLE